MCACPLWSKFYMSGEWEILTLAQLELVLASNVVPSVSRCLVTIVVNVPPSGGAPTAPTHSLPPWRIECRSPPRVTQIVTSPNDNEHVFGGCVSHSCPLHLHNVISILFAWIACVTLSTQTLIECVCMYFGLHCVCVYSGHSLLASSCCLFVCVYFRGVKRGNEIIGMQSEVWNILNLRVSMPTQWNVCWSLSQCVCVP